MIQTQDRVGAAPGRRQKSRPLKGFPIAGIGASAGGLEAFMELLRELPTNTGMAFVLVQHLDPSHKSGLTDILVKTTEMPVIEVANSTRVEPDHVYVVPPNAEATAISR